MYLFNRSILKTFLALSLFCLAIVSSASADQISKPFTFKNHLKSFSTDGCSSFPDGYPIINPDKWLKCCIDHDVAYWVGGTSEQREAADETLRKCVNATGAHGLGNDMYVGVRVGGKAELPTSWHWGYGWVIDRGTSPHLVHEAAQVKERMAELVGTNIYALPLAPSFLVRERESITGDYCLDISLRQLEVQLNKPVDVLSYKSLIENKSKSSATYKALYEIEVRGEEKRYMFEFELTKPQACVVPKNEVVARGQIRFMKKF